MGMVEELSEVETQVGDLVTQLDDLAQETSPPSDDMPGTETVMEQEEVPLPERKRQRSIAPVPRERKAIVFPLVSHSSPKEFIHVAS